MDVSSKDNSDYRILLQNKIRYLTIRPGTFNRSTLSTPLSSLPNLPGDDTWNCALISRDPASGELTIELQNRNLTGITDFWHPVQIDCLQLRRTRQLTATAFEATFCGSELISTTTLEKNITFIVKIARFEWEIPRLSRETSIYKQLQLQGISDLAPRFLGHVHEQGRVIGFILEKIEGREAGIEDLVGCQATLKRLHEFGIVHGDVNRYNFVVRGDGTVRLIDFEGSWQDKGAIAIMRAEMESLGIRDPAAYLRRSELATESAFDRDFNFITGIERSIERAGRDAENRGIDVASSGVRDLEAVGLDAGDVVDGGVDDRKKGGAGAGAGAGGKRKRGGDTAGGGGTRAEMEFLRRAEERGVRVVRAPKGMSRNKGNGSRWLGRNQCLVWTVEWILSDGEKRMRNCSELAPVADSFDRVVPLPKEEGGGEEGQKQTGDEKPEETSGSKMEEQQQQPQDATTTVPEPASTTEPTEPTDTPTAQPEASDLPLTPHRDLYFYLHRPRTATKQPVLAPLSPKTTIAAALRGHTVLEFPTIYVLPYSPDTIRAQEGSKYILEEEYLRTHQSPEESSEDTGGADDTLPPGAIDLQGVDESKVLEVLQKDLFEPSAAA
ncbi:hypothetical protein AtubIFM55763_009507 [Aspergillus tubingensis]|nr:hypothetical protein AtubIFM55763_009507 [Aspergillus tubingensis]GLA95003.1 hypothetical protein AtubIFM57143_001998 [Aspergillus tubingensis]